ncbi:Hypothetical protein FKW44_000427 [Caligus rogercresseyi]|uniref:Uncharacterized protein n=1 Tax=Caligus rogercresseyi TaxID=217165 RepID=A0A7T8KHH3_CALRO|nr:Hypothetical protein FKW44_000427 [Caligus rogercresseyi]
MDIGLNEGDKRAGGALGVDSFESPSSAAPLGGRRLHFKDETYNRREHTPAKVHKGILIYV